MQRVRALVVLAVLAGASLFASSASAVPLTDVTLPSMPVPEAEPNNDSAAAQAIDSGDRVRGNTNPRTDQDWYAFDATAGDKVFAATMTFASASGGDSVIDVLGPDGTTVLQSDDEHGTVGASSSSISGLGIPTTGTYYIRVQYSGASPLSELLPYDLYFNIESGTPTPETEPNTPGAPQALPAGGWVSGALSDGTDVDAYNLSLDAGDTVFVSLDLDPERDGSWNGAVTMAGFGTGTPLFVNDATVSTPTNPASEALFATVRSDGTYRIEVAGIASEFGTYRLSVLVIPAQVTSCRVYDSSGPVTIPADPATTPSQITVPGGDDATIGRVAVQLDLTHNRMQDLDVTLASPAGNEIGLFSDTGSGTAGLNTVMRAVLDQAAALSPAFANFDEQMLQLEGASGGGRLQWLEGERSSGTWTLNLRDDTAVNGGTLNSWQLVVCPREDPTDGEAVYSSDFEAGDGGFTHTGIQDEWELGLPSAAPITTCASGTQCWKTDLDSTYNASSDQELLSPEIVLEPGGPARLRWMQRFQLETTNFDQYWVDVTEVGGTGRTKRVFEWNGPTMTASVGNPGVTVNETSGWAPQLADISEFAGSTIRVRFHVTTDSSIQLSGVAIDDVLVTQNTPPDTTIDSGPTGNTTDTTPTFEFSADEGGATFECRIVPPNGAPFASCTSPFTSGALALGTYIFEVRATDTDGNPDSTSALRAFNVVAPENPGGTGPGPGENTPDTTPPSLTLGGSGTQKLGKSVGVVVSALTEDMTVSATGTVSVPKASRVYRLGAVRNVAIARGAKKTLRLKISKKARTAIARALKAKKRVRATIRITARDASGNVASAKRTIRLKR